MKVSPVCLQKHLSMDHLEGYQEQISLLKLFPEGSIYVTDYLSKING